MNTLESLKELPQKQTCGLLRMLAEDVNLTLAKASRASRSGGSCEARDVLSDNWVWCGVEVTDKSLYKECYENGSDSSSYFGDNKDCMPAEADFDSYQNISPTLVNEPGEPVKYPWGSVFYPWSYRVNQRLEKGEGSKYEEEVNAKWMKYFQEEQENKANGTDLKAPKWSSHTTSKSPPRYSGGSDHGSFQSGTQSSTPRNKLLPYGSPCHSYVCVKKCKESIYDSRMRDQEEQAERKRTLQRIRSSDEDRRSSMSYNYDDYAHTSCPQLQKKSYPTGAWPRSTDQIDKRNQYTVQRSQTVVKPKTDVRSFETVEGKGKTTSGQSVRARQWNKNQGCSLQRDINTGRAKSSLGFKPRGGKLDRPLSPTKAEKAGSVKSIPSLKPTEMKKCASYPDEKAKLSPRQNIKMQGMKKIDSFHTEKDEKKGKGIPIQKPSKTQEGKQSCACDQEEDTKTNPTPRATFKPWDEKRWTFDPPLSSRETKAENEIEETRDDETDKYIIQFVEPDGLRCKIIAKNGAIAPETPKTLKLMIVEVDVVDQTSEKTGYKSGCNTIRSLKQAGSKTDDNMEEDNPVQWSGSLENAHSVSWVKNNVRDTGISHISRPPVPVQGRRVVRVKGQATGDKGPQNTFFARVRAQDIDISLTDGEKVSTFQDPFQSLRKGMPWSDASCYLGAPAILKGLSVIETCFCPNRPNMLLTLHSRHDNETSSYDSVNMVVCVWNINRPSSPVRYLTSDDEVRCLCLSPKTARLAFAGMNDGSVGVWDLEETDSLHVFAMIKSEEFLLRFPTYYSPQSEDPMGHIAPIINITTVLHGISGVPQPPRSSTSSGSSLTSRKYSTPPPDDFDSFHVAGLTESGVIIFWQLDERRDLPPHPKLTLNMILQISLTQEIPDCLHLSSLGTLILQINHITPKRSADGKAVTAVETGASPELYVGGYLGYSSCAPCVRLSPFCKFSFLVGSVSGSVYLCHTRRSKPVLRFCLPDDPEGQPRMIEWSPSRPGVFFVLCGNSNLNIFDLLENRRQPIRTQRIHDQPIITMSLSPDLRYTNAPRFPYRPRLFMTTSEGVLIVRTLSSVCTERQGPDEKRFLESIVTRRKKPTQSSTTSWCE